MALWQYNIIIIPKNALNSSLMQSADCIKRGEYEKGIFWKKRPTKSSSFKAFAKILPTGKSWHSSLTVYGELDKSCVEVFEDDDGFIEEVIVKIDFRTEFLILLNHLIEYAISNSLSLLDKDLCLLPLNITQIKIEILNSEEYEKYNELLQLGDIDF